MVAAQQDLGDLHAAEDARPGVLRILEPARDAMRFVGRTLLVAQDALVQVAEARTRRQGHGAGVGALQTGDDAQQRRLAAAVRAHDAGALAVSNRERHA